MQQRWIGALFPSPGDVFFVVTFLLVLLSGQTISNRDGDLGRHLAVGNTILGSGEIPTRDLFSHTMRGEPLVPHEWLAEVAFALSHRAAGFPGVALLTALCIALPFGGLVATTLRRGVSPLAVMAVAALGVLTSMAHWATRPHVFSFVFVFLFATRLEALRRGERRGVYALVPLTALWANLHGAFVVGFVLVGTYLVGALIVAVWGTAGARGPARGQAAHLAAVLGLSVAASALNPAGPRLTLHAFSYLRPGLLLDITQEYRSPDFHHPLFVPFLILLLLALVVSVRREVAPTLLLLSWAAFSLHSLRNIPLFVIVSIPLLAESLDDYLRSLASHLPSMRGWTTTNDELRATLRPGFLGPPSWLAVGVATVVLLSGRTLALDRSDYGFREGDFPLAAMARFGPDPPGERIFNPMHWGGYILFAAWPRIEVFLDGQTDFYGAELTREHLAVLEAEPGWVQVLDRYAVDWVLIEPFRPLATALGHDPSWHELYRDTTAVVYGRTVDSTLH